MNLGLGLGLSLNRGPSYGPELVTNGTFGTDTTGWTGVSATLSQSSGRLRVTNSSATAGRGEQAITVENGATYAYSADLFAGTALPRFGITNASGGSSPVLPAAGAGTVTGTFVSTSTTVYVSGRCASNTSGQFAEFDNISLKKVL